MVQKTGSPEFIEFLKSREGKPPLDPPPVPLTELAIVRRSSEGKANVEVQLEASGEQLVAERSGFPDGWHFQERDVVSVLWSEGRWSTLPEMAATRRSGNERTYWVRNQRGELRELGRSSLPAS